MKGKSAPEHQYLVPSSQIIMSWNQIPKRHAHLLEYIPYEFKPIAKILEPLPLLSNPKTPCPVLINSIPVLPHPPGYILLIHIPIQFPSHLMLPFFFQISNFRISVHSSCKERHQHYHASHYLVHQRMLRRRGVSVSPSPHEKLTNFGSLGLPSGPIFCFLKVSCIHNLLASSKLTFFFFMII